MGQRAQTVGEGGRGVELNYVILQLCYVNKQLWGKRIQMIEKHLKALAHFHVNAKTKSLTYNLTAQIDKD